MSKDEKMLHELPDGASDQLPWFMNGTLPPEEEAAVARRLQQSPEVRAEFEDLREIADAVRENGPSDWRPSASHLSGVMAAIDAGDQPQAASSGFRLAEWLDLLGFGGRMVLGAQAAVILALVGVLAAGQLSSRNDAEFNTLTSANGAQIIERSIKIVFAMDAPAGEIQELLTSIDGAIVDGPSALGTFTISIPDDVQIDAASEALRNSPLIVFVQIQQVTSRD